MKKRMFVIFFLLIAISTSVSCSVFSAGSQSTPTTEDTVSSGIDQTLIALAAEQTIAAMPTIAAPQNEAQASEPTAMVSPLTDTPAPTATLAPTFTPTFTNTFTPTIIPTATVTVPSPTPDLTQTLEAQMDTAKILVYEDVSGSPDNLMARVDTAIKELGYTSENYVNVGSASGNFQTYLNSGIAWDLVIVALESRDNAKQGLIGDVIPHALNNGALIVEAWDLDAAEGRVLRLIDMCGVDVQKDWYRPNEYEPLDFFIHDLETNSPLIRTPNVVTFPLRPNFLWKADVGDVLKIAQGSDAQLIAGIYSNDPTMYGLLATCMDGRMVLQSFSSHDYRMNDSIMLWKNYIVYTLMNHFKALQ